jgi:hypothetical protein
MPNFAPKIDVKNRAEIGQKFGLFWSTEFSPLLGGGLEPHFRVLFSAIFHGIAQGNCDQGRKRRILVEGKLLQTV